MGPATGVVVAFDAEKGYGTLRVDDPDGRELFFHCTRIADGSRRVDVGASVTFEIEAGQLGRWEATGLRPGP